MESEMISPRNLSKINSATRSPQNGHFEDGVSVDKGLKRVLQNDSSFLNRLDGAGRGSLAAAPTGATSNVNLFED